MAVDYRLTDGNIGYPVINTVSDTTPRIELGTIAQAKDISTGQYGVGEFMYVKFTGTVAAGDLVKIDRYNKTGVVSPAAATKGVCFGIAMAAQASGQYGWVMIRGVHDDANVLNGATVQEGPNYGSALNAGRITSAVTANYIIDGLAIRVTGAGANRGTVEAYYPNCSGR